MMSRNQIGIALVAVALALIVLAVQVISVLALSSYCDENITPGSSRENVCSIAESGGYLLALVLPPAGVVLAGMVGARRGKSTPVMPAFAIALVVGLGVPLIAILVTNNR
jgi:hypothetical protein